MSWFSPNPGSTSDMVLTGVLDCPLLPCSLTYRNSLLILRVVEMLYVKAVCELHSAIKMGSIICVLQKSMVVIFEITKMPYILLTSISNF